MRVKLISKTTNRMIFLIKMCVNLTAKFDNIYIIANYYF